MCGTLPAPRAYEVPDLSGVSVELESGGILDTQFVRDHWACTGALPEVGQPLRRRVDALPAPFNVVTYGKVAKITGTPK